MDERKSIARRFSAAADTYDYHAGIQQVAAKEVTRLVTSLSGVNRILEVGCGTGILTQKIRARFPDSTICAVDISEAMIARARARLSQTENVIWIMGDTSSINEMAPFDLIVSSSSLHWMFPATETFRHLSAAVNSGRHFVFSLMLDGTLGELHASRRRVAPHKPVQARLPTAGEVQKFLNDAGFHMLQKSRTSLHMTYPAAAEFLRSIHEQGLTGGPVSSDGIHLCRRELEQLIMDYDVHYRFDEQGVRATYEIMYVVARKNGT
jgi:malonyl-CoA O-methyltransferase